jgi:hypothetical protein
MSFATKSFDAQDAIVTALQASASLTAWRIDFGIPAGRPEEQHIWLDEEILDWTQELATTGLVTRNETFRLSIYIYDKKTGATAEEIRDEIKTAAYTIADIIGNTPVLGGIVLISEVVGGAYEGAFADPQGIAREGVLKLTIECQAFIA